MNPVSLPPIRGLHRDRLAQQFQDWHQPAWRLDQLLQWLYPRTAEAWDEMSNLPKSLRQLLAQSFHLELPALARLQGSADTTRKFLWHLADGALIESVLIPANPALYGDRADRHTVCVSTQVGCAYGCRFCASGLDGWKRNLTPDEIVGQILATERWHRLLAPSSSPSPDHPTPDRERRVDNLVIMGMGEPLANYDHLLAALRLLNAPWGYGLGARKITVSTSGLAPKSADSPTNPNSSASPSPSTAPPTRSAAASCRSTASIPSPNSPPPVAITWNVRAA
jgi:23S rRNA (adenine2503-C2)-methyltransferase